MTWVLVGFYWFLMRMLIFLNSFRSKIGLYFEMTRRYLLKRWFSVCLGQCFSDFSRQVCLVEHVYQPTVSLAHREIKYVQRSNCHLLLHASCVSYHSIYARHICPYVCIFSVNGHSCNAWWKSLGCRLPGLSVLDTSAKATSKVKGVESLVLRFVGFGFGNEGMVSLKIPFSNWIKEDQVEDHGLSTIEDESC